MKHLIFFFAAVLLLLPGCKQGTPVDLDEVQTGAYTVYLVRHAEKQKGDNPGLTEVGQARAELLKFKLMNSGIDYIHSSDYKRTRATAAPLAKATGINVDIYDAGDLQQIADKVKSMPGVHVIVGHSNTTPQLASLLSGEIVDAMPETEYDRFIEVGLDKDGNTIRLDISRFGTNPKSADD